MDCNQRFPWYVMEFDHRDGEVKFKHIAALVGHAGMDKIKKEIKKCDLVCSNCHKIRTYYRGQHANRKL